MCILFLHVNPKPSPGQFRLILAANRDEYFKRPSLPAHRWEEDPSVIGGRDVEPGKEGGSWLALSSHGRVAALLNIMGQGDHPPQLMGRGSLVTDFVKGSATGQDYLNKIERDSFKYRPFNFLTIEIGQQNIEVCEYSNVGDAPKPVSVDQSFVGISNSPLEQPFEKVIAGTGRFKNIVEQFGRTESREPLREQLLSFLKWKDSHFPDQVLANRVPNAPAEDLKPFSSVFVNAADRGYGTRAHSIIMVDTEARAYFSEWAMNDPIDPSNPTWGAKHFTCQLDV